MKTWQIYTIIGIAACVAIMQTWTTYLAVQSMGGVPIKAVQYLKKKEINKKLNSYTSTTYYWRVIPKDQLTEEYVGTLYETEDDVIIVTKKTETNYIGPEDSFYTDPNNPAPF